MERWECGHNWGVWHPDDRRLSQRSQRLWSPSARWWSFYLTVCLIRISWTLNIEERHLFGNELFNEDKSVSILCGHVGHEGRIGMAAVTVKEDAQFDGSKIYNLMVSYLPSYARPRFIRIQVILFHTHYFTLHFTKTAGTFNFNIWKTNIVLFSKKTQKQLRLRSMFMPLLQCWTTHFDVHFSHCVCSLWSK